MTTTETAPIEATFEIVPAELGLEPAAKHSLEIAFTGFFAEARKWQSAAATITDPKAARAARLELKAVRVNAEKVRKSLKEDSLRMGKAIDGANNILLALIVPIEAQLDDIEKAEARKEAARIEALREERAETLDSLGHVSHGINLGTLSEPDWKEYLQQAKDVYEVRQARAKREAEEAAAEAKRQAEEKEAARLETARLIEESKKAMELLAEERRITAEREAASEKARVAAEEKARKEREAVEAKAKAERDAAAAKQAKLEAEAKALRDAEAKRIADEKAAADAKAKADALAAKKAAAAPDADKLRELSAQIRALNVPVMKTTEAKELAIGIGVKLDELANWIGTKAATL